MKIVVKSQSESRPKFFLNKVLVEVTIFVGFNTPVFYNSISIHLENLLLFLDHKTFEETFEKEDRAIHRLADLQKESIKSDPKTYRASTYNPYNPRIF